MEQEAPTDSAASAEVASIEATMFNADGTKNPAYWSNPEASDRLRTLLAPGEDAEPAAAVPEEATLTHAHPARAEPAQHPYSLGEYGGEPEVEGLAEVLHAAGASQDLMSTILAGIDDDQDYSDIDAEDRDSAREYLGQVWGPDFQSKLSSVKRYLKHNLPPGVEEMLLGARVNGRAMLNDPGTLADLAALAERAPQVPAPTGDITKDIAAIERVMSEDPAGYRRDVGLQLRLRSLYAKRGGSTQQ